MIEEALVSILQNDSGVNAITTRVYPVDLPQNPVFPAVIYMKISGMRDHALSGPTGHAHPRFQIEAWATTYSAAKGLARAIRQALDGYSGTVGDVEIGSILIESERDFYEPEVKCHRTIMDFMIWHTEN